MPDFEEHCKLSEERYGKKFEHVHRWMDAPAKLLGYKHRMHRHDLGKTPSIVEKIWGPSEAQVCVDHIMDDYEAGEIAKGQGTTKAVTFISRFLRPTLWMVSTSTLESEES